MKKFTILFLSIAFILTSCRNDIDSIDVTESTYEPPVIEWNQLDSPVNGSLIGFVVDETGAPITDAEISLGEKNVSTDMYGHFFFEDILLNAEGTYVKAYKAGYFNGSRRFFPIEGQVNQIKIELISQNFNQVFNSTQGGEITMNGAATIVFNENSIINENGSTFTGSVNVAARWLDPSDTKTFDQMPGNLQGVNLLSEEVVLSTYGMIAVELQSDMGEALNLKENSPATIRMPIPSSLQANAPTEIPLWSFNEEHGIWVEEGKAILNDEVYIGEVTHFSFWNCDVPYPLVQINGRIETVNETPLANTKIEIITNQSSVSGTGYTSSEGLFSGMVPKGEDLVLKVLNECNNVLFTYDISALNEDTDIGSLLTGNVIATEISGYLFDCAGDVVTDGLLIINYDNQTIYKYIDSYPFSISVFSCEPGGEIEIIGVDLITLQQSKAKIISVGGIHHLEELFVCGQELENYIRLTIDSNVLLLFTAFYGHSGLNSSRLGTFDTDKFFVLNISGQGVGNYGSMNDVEELNLEDLDWVGSGVLENLEITEAGAIGEPVKGTFSGVLVKYPEGTESEVAGVFNANRTQ